MQVLRYILYFIWLSGGAIYAQSASEISLSDLSAFQDPPANWKIVGQVMSEMNKKDKLQTKAGSGILVNDSGKSNARDIATKMEHGDMDLELEFMMAKGSNSGIYLQGRYEIQLLDSWGKQRVNFGDCGGVYERWNEAAPAGREGFEGYAPRANVCRAPGLWQKLSISFQAPRFDGYGNKTSNARLLRVTLNDVVIHENLELTGPTRGAWGEEAARGPLRIQGDHGSVAFRNIGYRLYDRAPIKLGEMQFSRYFAEEYGQITTPVGLELKEKGKTEALTHEVTGETSKFALLFEGKLNIPVDGTYRFEFDFYGLGNFRLDGKPLVERAWRKRSLEVDLTKGTYPFELFYIKIDEWLPNGVALYISGPGIRRQPLHLPSSEPLSGLPQQMFIDYQAAPKLVRSFVDFREPGAENSHRITHAISVGLPGRLAYGYNLSNGALYQVWKGGFLDATPMWNSRGDGSSRALGSVIALADRPALALLANAQQAWPDSLPANAAYRPRGYRLDEAGLPTFRYDLYGGTVEDRLATGTSGSILQRRLQTQDVNGSLYHLAARGKDIVHQDGDYYRVDGRYFIRLPEKSPVKAQIRTVDGQQELLLPVTNNELLYEIVW